MNKLGRKYELSVEIPGNKFLVIEPPFTVEFDITRNTLSSANTSKIRVYNQSEKNRSLMYKDRFDVDLRKQVIFRAGYGDNLPVVFSGNISQCFSVREGVNFITEIDSFDSGFAYVNGQTDTTFPPGTSQRDIFLAFIGGLPNVQRGAVGSFPNKLARGVSISGNTTELLRELSGGGFFIDNGKAYCLGDAECLQGEIEVITSASGLLGTPRREETYLTFDILFEPRLIIGQKILLNSITGANFNTFYKVVSLKHKGIISESVSGEAVTSVGVFFGPESLTTVQQ